MSSILSKKRIIPSAEEQPLRSRYATIRSWLLSWEVYLIVFVAAFLRLYRIGTTEFDDDQAAVFAMARNAVTHGYLIATANVASIHIYNPPATIYFFMLPAALSDAPMWGAVMVGVLMTASVLLTYFFTRRYYGRVAGTIAALTYATAFLPVFYSRFIWNQNLLPIFTLLFFMALFWGVVERRKGWLFPALFLLGLLIQLHATGILMAVPLLVALVLAPDTVRWRDLALGLLSVFLLYLPYLLWEVPMHFIDVQILLDNSHQKAVIDNEAWLFYQSFFSPYNILPPPNTLLSRFVPFLSWLGGTMTFLVLASVVMVLVLSVRSWGQPEQKLSTRRGWQRVAGYFIRLRGSPYRCGLVLLLCWQIIPLILLSRHTIILHPHYFIIFLPGPFILIGFFLAKVAQWLRQRNGMGMAVREMRYVVYALAVLLIAAQFVGSTARVVDYARGNYDDGPAAHTLYYDLRSLRTAVTEADQVAQQHHFSRVYIATTSSTQASLRYLSGQMHTPTTLFTDATCAVLPGASEGPAVLLVAPYSDFTTALVTHFAATTLIDEPRRPGGAPFRLYIVTPPAQRTASGRVLDHDLQLLDASAHSFSFNNTPWLVTRWSLLRSAQPSYRTLYGYNMTLFSSSSGNQSVSGQNTDRQCVFTAMRAGDQLLAAFNQPQLLKGSLHPSSTVSIGAQSYNVTPYNLRYGPLTFETYYDVVRQQETLYTSAGKASLDVFISRSS